MSSFHQILVPTDFGPASSRALEHALDLATTLSASVTLIHTYELPAYDYSEMVYLSAAVLDAIEVNARKALDAQLAEVRKRIPTADSILHCGSPIDDILSAVDSRKIDLVVMGTHGRRGVRHALLGSVAEKVVRLSPVPVLTVHEAPATK